LAILEEIGVIDLEAWVIWTTLLAILAVGFGLEYRYKSKSGSCYVVACGSKACSSSGGGDEFCMNNNNNNNEGDHARIYKYVPGSTLGASIIIAVVLHYLFLVKILIPFPYNLLGLLIVGSGVYLAFQSVRLLISYNTTFEAGRWKSLIACNEMPIQLLAKPHLPWILADCSGNCNYPFFHFCIHSSCHLFPCSKYYYYSI